MKPCRTITFLLLLLLGVDALGIPCAPKTAVPGFFGVSVSRARYYNPEIGRFWTMDSYEGNHQNPLSLHKYLYCHADPVDRADPSGHFSNWIYGREVHRAIGRDFLEDTGARGPRYSSQPVSQLLAVKWTPATTASQPDLVEIPMDGDSIVYEIKPVGSYIAGRTQLGYYLGLLNSLDPQKRTWREGTAAEYTPPRIVWLSWGNYAVVQPPQNGVILYDVQGVNMKHLIMVAVLSSQVRLEAQVSQAILTSTLARVPL